MGRIAAGRIGDSNGDNGGDDKQNAAWGQGVDVAGEEIRYAKAMINSIVYIGYAEDDNETRSKQGKDTGKGHSRRLLVVGGGNVSLFTLDIILIVTLLVDPNRLPQLTVDEGHLR